VPNHLRTLATAILLVAVAWPAQARSLRIAGTSGYLSEWELKAEVTASKSGGREEFSGPLTLRHTGLCTPNGAVEKSGTIRFHISKSVWSSEIHATLLIDGSQCTYNAKLSDSSSGFMDCPGGNAIPLTMSMQ
jgi:hypothetical protein